MKYRPRHRRDDANAPAGNDNPCLSGDESSTTVGFPPLVSLPSSTSMACVECEAPVGDTPVIDENERFWLSAEEASYWCSEDCRDASAERQSMAGAYVVAVDND